MTPFKMFCRLAVFLIELLVLTYPAQQARSEAMLQLFNVDWEELTRKMPEIAEAGYTSLWLPPPSKAGSVFSVGYDLFDPFDLGDKDQRGTIPTRYGTKEQLLRAVETAHRFGLRVYFDNIMNHRGFDVPGYNSNTPTNLYPGLRPQDFHLQTISGGYFRNWPNVGNWNNVFEVQNQPLFGLLDLAIEPGPNNVNFGVSLGSSLPKPAFVRQPASNSYYMDTNLPAISGPWRPFNGNAGDPVPEDVGAYVIRSALWLLNETRCDGFRFDAVKHVPAGFFGDTSDTPYGYSGAIQAMYDYVHGFGNNLLSNGYFETGGNRDSLFDSEAPRNDALLFGEHLGEPPGYGDYLARGMRLLNSPYHYQLNNVLGNPSATLAGLEQRDYTPYSSAFGGPQSVLFAQSHDDGYAKLRELQHAYNFTREGLPSIYSDGYNQSTATAGQDPFPRVAYAPYLGQFGDRRMPDVAYLHHQLARGGTRARWGDADIVAYERYDYRETSNAYDNPDSTVVLFAMNDNSASDISFDDGAAQNSSGTYYDCFPVSSSRGQGLVVGFPPGTVLVQLADASSGACGKLLVRQATASLAEAMASVNDPNPINRKVYIGSQALFPGGGAIEFKVPKNGYVAYGLQWPEPSRVSNSDAITFRQGGLEVPRLTVLRHDGVDGDAGFNPVYPFKMRGSVDASGNIIRGTNVGDKTYAIDVPILTNGNFDVLLRCDASAANLLLKLDGGIDLNSHLGFTPVTGFDRRDNKPGSATDVFLGYEQTVLESRYGPEKFAARLVSRNNVTSLGAETYYYTIGGGQTTVNASGNGAAITGSTAAWVYHDPTAPGTMSGAGTPSQRVPIVPAAGQDVQIFVKVGYRLQINRCYIYYTLNGTNPEGAFGRGFGDTRVAQATWVGPDAADPNIDWWRGVIAGSEHGANTQVRYKVALFHAAVDPMPDSDSGKVYGLTRAAITNFNPISATVWLHNNLNTNHTVSGLQEGFHIARARAFLARSGKSSAFNTFLQTFYYDAGPPAGAVAFPAEGAALMSSRYEVVVRADNSTTGVEFNIVDSDPANDDVVTGANNGNGLLNGAPKFAAATPTNANAGISAQYPALPKEYRFTYVGVPSSGTATITIRLRESSTDIFPNRLTTITRTVNTLGPAATVTISAPQENALLVLAATNITTIRSCFTSTLTSTNVELFSILINGVLQPRTSYAILAPGGACGNGFRTLLYNWTNAAPGTNLIQVVYTNFSTIIEDSTRVAVARPGDSDGDGLSDAAEVLAGTDPYDAASALRISEIDGGNKLIVWDSQPDRRYQVLGTTNLSQPMIPISPVIQGSGASTFYFDSAPGSAMKFYRVQVVP